VRGQGRRDTQLRLVIEPSELGQHRAAAIVQTCIVHLIRNTFRLTSRKYWDELKRDVRPIYTAVNEPAARSAFEAMAQKWAQRYPAVVRLWDNAWSEFIPFLDYELAILRRRRLPGMRLRDVRCQTR
jgi:putative transposase